MKVSSPTNGTQLQQQIHLRLGINVLPPLTFVEKKFKNGTALVSGFLIPVIEFAYGIPGVTWDYYPSKRSDAQVYRMQNGTWSGLGGKLQKQLIDVFVGPTIVNEEAFEEFGVLNPNTFERLSVIASVGKPENRNFFGFLFIVDSWIWYSLFFSFFLLILTSASVDNSMNFTMSAVSSGSKRYFWIYLAALFCEGSPKSANTRSSQMLLFTWLYFIIIFSNTLYSQFTAVLTVQGEDDRMVTMEDLASRESLFIFSLKKSHAEPALSESPMKHYNKIFERATRSGGFVGFNQFISPATYQKVKDGDAALITVKPFTTCVLSSFCLKLKGNRKFYYLEEDFYYHYFSHLYNKNNVPPILKKLDRRRRSYLETGHEIRFFASCSKNYWKCELDGHKEEEASLKLGHLVSVFYLTIICLTVSFWTFLLECVIYKCTRK